MLQNTWIWSFSYSTYFHRLIRIFILIFLIYSILYQLFEKKIGHWPIIFVLLVLSHLPLRTFRQKSQLITCLCLSVLFVLQLKTESERSQAMKWKNILIEFECLFVCWLWFSSCFFLWFVLFFWYILFCVCVFKTVMLSCMCEWVCCDCWLLFDLCFFSFCYSTIALSCWFLHCGRCLATLFIFKS